MENKPAFCVQQLIRFSHCDPAGIVYYPQYFNMFQSLIEDWFNTELKINYADFITVRQLGLPTARIECDFMVPSKIGEVLDLSLQIKRVGSKSFTLAIVGKLGNQLRIKAENVLVTTSLQTHTAILIPEDLLEKLNGYQQSTNHQQLKEGES